MRYLVLLRGAAGCGKSTWVQQNGLKQYTLSPDEIRLMLQSPITLVDGSKAITQANDKEVWEMLKTMLRKRMSRGEFCIVDATHARPGRVNEFYKDLCNEYRYRCYAVQFNVPLQIILERNRQRDTYKFVPEDVIKTHFAQLEQPLSNWVKTVNPVEFFEHFPNILSEVDLNEFNKIHIFGDIHGCVEPLKEYFSKYPVNEKEFFIFTGDYIDRGIQNKEVLQFLLLVYKLKNVLLLEGNHEKWLRLYADNREEEIKSSEFLKYTIPQIKDLDKGDLREFCRKLGQVAYFTFSNKTYFVNHGGVPCLPSPYMASEEYFKGVGKYEQYLEVENSFENLTREDTIQIHAHRNTENSPIYNGNRIYNLCDTVEFGGYLRVLRITKSGIEEEKIKNNIFFVKEEQSLPVFEDPKDILTQLRNNMFIYENKLTDKISSFNFTDRAFYNKVWNEQTQRARGLFINTETLNVVARAYDKFFNVGENDSTKLPELRRNLVFPVQVYEKYNGFLGIVGYDEEEGLWITSKSSNKSDFSTIFKEILQNKVDLKLLENFVQEEKVCLVFEVLSQKDPHIIQYYTDNIILLDVIYREFEYKKYSYSELRKVAQKFGFNFKEWVCELNSYNEFYEFVNSVEGNLEHTCKGEFIEGYVLEDATGFMVKLKTEYYKLWKFFRGIAVSMAKGRPVDTKLLFSPEKNRIYAFLKTLDKETLSKPIIELRNLYERSL